MVHIARWTMAPHCLHAVPLSSYVEPDGRRLIGQKKSQIQIVFCLFFFFLRKYLIFWFPSTPELNTTRVSYGTSNLKFEVILSDKVAVVAHISSPALRSRRRSSSPSSAARNLLATPLPAPFLLLSRSLSLGES